MNRVRQELDSLPWNRASKKEWEKRGYRVKKCQYNVQYLKIWNGMHYNRIKIYDIEQCAEIRGIRAALRREMWLSQFDNIIAL